MKVNKMSLQELLESYTGDQSSEITAELLKRSKSKPFIVYTKEGQVDVQASVTIYEENQDGIPAPKFYSGRPVYKAGEVPTVKTFDENPIRPGTPLRGNGECSVTTIPWGSIDFEIRQILRVAYSTRELTYSNQQDEWDLYELAANPEKVRARFPKAVHALALMVDKPSLKIIPIPSAQQTQPQVQMPVAKVQNNSRDGGRNALLVRLQKLPEPQFKQVVFVLSPPAGILPADTAPQTTRAVALIEYYCNQSFDAIKEINNVIDQLDKQAVQVVYGSGNQIIGSVSGGVVINNVTRSSTQINNPRGIVITSNIDGGEFNFR